MEIPSGRLPATDPRMQPWGASDHRKLYPRPLLFYAWPRQVADFCDIRVRKNFEFGQRFGGVGGMADLVGLQREYVRDTFLDYASSVYEMAGGGIWDRIIDEFAPGKSPLHAHLEDLEVELAAFERLRRIAGRHNWAKESGTLKEKLRRAAAAGDHEAASAVAQMHSPELRNVRHASSGMSTLLRMIFVIVPTIAACQL